MQKKEIIKEYIIKNSDQEIICDLRRKKCKRLSITVHPDLKVKITAPFNMSDTFIEDALKEKTAWIVKSVNKLKKCRILPSPEQYVSGERLAYLGDEYTLKVIQGKREPAVISDKNLIVSIPRTDTQSVKKAVDKWYRNQAEELFTKYLDDNFPTVSPYVNVTPMLKIRIMKRKWGSCSISGKITLNLRLIELPPECIEFIVMHELCHLKHPNHSKYFYAFLFKCMPDWKEKDITLKGFRL